MLRVVSGALFDDDGNVLMGLRKNHVKRPNLWELPGGKVEFGEAPESALAREWHEELGVDNIEVCDFIASAMFDLENRFSIDLFVVRTQDRPCCIDHQELRWVRPMYAVMHLPCSPGFYTHYPALRWWIAEEKTIADQEWSRVRPPA